MLEETEIRNVPKMGIYQIFCPFDWNKLSTGTKNGDPSTSSLLNCVPQCHLSSELCVYCPTSAIIVLVTCSETLILFTVPVSVEVQFASHLVFVGRWVGARLGIELIWYVRYASLPISPPATFMAPQHRADMWRTHFRQLHQRINSDPASWARS